MGMINQLHHHEHPDYKKLRIVNLLSLLMGFAMGLLLYIASSYFKKLLGSDNIGWTFLVANSILLFVLLYIQKLVRIVRKTLLFHLILIVKITLLIALLLLVNHPASLFLLIGYIIFEALSWVLLSMIIESYATDKDSGKIYGINLTITNIGLVLAPLISTQLLTTFNFVGVFSVAIILHVIIFLIAYFYIQDTPLHFNEKIGLTEMFKKIYKRTDIMEIFFVSFIVEFFFAIMVIYTPLYLLTLGFTWLEIGTTFSIMLIPFLLVEYPVGILADQKYGEKKLLFFAIILIACTMFSFAFIYGMPLWSVITILFLSRVGASIIEELRASYFYKRIDSRDIDFISFFGMARPLAFIIAPALASLFLVIFPLRDLFIFTAFIVLLALYPIYKLQNNRVTQS